jgi:hypothetical protein
MEPVHTILVATCYWRKEAQDKIKDVLKDAGEESYSKYQEKFCSV